MKAAPTDEPLIRVRGLRVRYAGGSGPVEALRGVDIDVRGGEVIGLVGESGAGKTSLLYAMTRLMPEGVEITADAMRFGDVDLLAASPGRMRAIRGSGIGMIHQHPRESLNPVFTVGEQIAEVARVHERASRRGARALAVDRLARVEVSDPERVARAYPHELSGGECQRAMIALALAGRPDVLLADEPTAALDATTQARILALLRSLVAEFGMAVVMVTHDLRIVAELADRMAVMYAGRVVETGPVRDVIRSPEHPYTRRLTAAVPRLGAAKGPIGEAAFARRRSHECSTSGCRYRAYCSLALDRCVEAEPLLQAAKEPGRSVACFKSVTVPAQSSGGAFIARLTRPAGRSR